MKTITQQLLLLLLLFNFGYSQIADNTIQEEQDYAFGYGLYQDKLFQLAVDQLKYFVEKYPSSIKQTDALFILGESYLNTSDTIQALRRFEIIDTKYQYNEIHTHTLYRMGEIFYGLHQYQNSAKYFSRLTKEYPAHKLFGQAAYWSGESFYQLQQLSNAHLFYSISADSSTTHSLSPYAFYSIGWLYEKQGNFENSLTRFKLYLQNFKNDESKKELTQKVVIHIGEVLYSLKRYEDVLLHFSEIGIDLADNSILSGSMMYLQGISNLALGKIPEARKYLLNFEKQYPDHELINKSQYTFALSFIQTKEYDEAIKLLSKISQQKSPYATEATYRLAYTYRLIEKKEDAILTFQKVATQFPTHELADDALFDAGELLFDLKKYQQSFESYSKLIDKFQTSSLRGITFKMIGEINLVQKNYKEAEKSFSNILTIPNTNDTLKSEAIFQKGWSSYKAKKYNEAINSFSDYIVLYKSYPLNHDAVFWLSETYFALQQFSNAEKNYKEFIRQAPNHQRLPDALHGLGWSLYNQKLYAQSIQTFQTLLNKYPTHELVYDAQLRLADAFYYSKKYTDAVSTLSDLIKKFPSNKENDYAIHQLAQSYYKVGNMQKAIQVFKDLSGKFAQSEYADDALYTTGWIYFREKKYPEAIQTFSNFIEGFSKSDLLPRAYYSIADAYYNSGNYEKAIESYSIVITKFPETEFILDAFSGIVYCYVLLEKPLQSITLIDNFIADNPKSNIKSDLLLQKSELFFTNDKVAESITTLNQIITDYPKSKIIIDAQLKLSKAYRTINQQQNAINILKPLSEKNKSNEYSPRILLELGLAQIQQGMRSEAQTTLARIEREYPKSFESQEASFQQGIIFQLLRKDDDAINKYSSVIAQHPKSNAGDKSRVALAKIYTERKDFNKGIELFKTVALSHTDELGAESQYSIGMIYQTQNPPDYTEAILSFMRVRYVYPASGIWIAKSYLQLGECYEKTNQKIKAKESYNFVLKQTTEFGLITEAKRRLKELEQL